MESMRDVNRVMEREIAKGSCPLKLSHIEFDADSYQEIMTEEKLHDVLSYLLRTGEYSQYAGKTIVNNVYMDLKGRNPVFRRTKTGIERNHIFSVIKRYAKKLCLEYNGNVFLETVRCYFDIPEDYLEKCQYIYEDKETYAFVMSDKYIVGLYAHCLMARKEATIQDRQMDRVSEKECQRINLEFVKKVLFQALLLDDVKMDNRRFYADLHTIFRTEEKIE